MMLLRSFFAVAIATAAVACGLAATGCASVVRAPGPVADASSSPSQARAPLQALPHHERRFGRPQPVVAVVARNDGTELFDFLVPYGILARSGAAKVVAVAPEERPLRFRPRVTLQPQATFASFDRDEPRGADYVIVPAVGLEEARDPVLLDWVRAQAAKGATVVGICDGVFVLGHAGLLKGHEATGHWATQADREDLFPDTRWRRDARYVADGPVVTTAGVSAAMPAAFALVEAIAGRAAAADLARSLGASGWDPAHDGSAFHMTAGLYLTAGLNYLTPSDELRVHVRDGVDELRLALMVDALGRTFRSRPRVVAETATPVRTRDGLVLLPGLASEATAGEARIRDLSLPDGPPLQALDIALDDIRQWYGAATADFVALQMEYPAPSVAGRLTAR